MKHTPGTWQVEYLSTFDIFTIECATARQSHIGASTGKRADPEHGEANARLISAAPALLDALLDLTALYAASPGHDPRFVSKAQAAIAKAEGTKP